MREQVVIGVGTQAYQNSMK